MLLSKKAKHLTEKQKYDQLGRMLVNIYETGYIDRNTAYKMSFIKGMLSGFGGVLGATILVGLLLWTLSLFKDVPFVNTLAKNVQHTLQSKSVSQ